MIFTSTYKPAGTKTFRLASSKFLDIFGGNGQNQPDSSRRMFIPRPGYGFVQCDLEGAEAVAVALLCGEGNFRELVRRKVKIHNYLCVKLFPDKFTDFFTNDQVQSLTPVAFHEHSRYKELVKHCKELKTEYDLAKRTVHGCLTDDHEVLTAEGWKNIAYVVSQQQHEIAVTDGNRWWFERPSAYIYNPSYTGELHILTNAYGTVDITMTADHRVPYMTNGKLKMTTPPSIPQGAKLPYACTNNGKLPTMQQEFVQLLCAFHADGHINGCKRVQFHFQKERKIIRLAHILQRLSLEPWRKRTNGDFSCTIELDNEASAKLISFGKQLTWNSLSWSTDEMYWYINECQHWDGYIADNQECVFTTSPQQAEIIHTMARLCGVGSSWNTHEREEPRKEMHRIGFSGRRYASYTSCEHSYKRCINFPVYCFTTSTGMFLVRRKRAIMITGNSNYGMAWKTFQKTVLKGTEGKVVLPAAECKRLLEVYKAVFPELSQFQLTAEHAVRHSLPITNLFGNQIIFIQRFTDALARTGIAWAPQSTVGLCGLIAALRLQDVIETQSRKWNILTITHDSNLAEAPIPELELLADEMVTAMTFEFTSPIDGWKCKIGVEKQIGFNWGKHSPDNPNGLQVK